MTFTQARRLRRLYATGEYRQRELARRYGVSLSQARLVLVNRVCPEPGYTYQRPRPRWPRGKLGALLPELRRLRQAGASLGELARLVGSSRQAVHRRLKPDPLPQP